MCVFISTSSRLDSRLSARPTAHSQPGIVYLGVGWSLPMSALEPLRAFIYSSRLDSRLSARPFIVGAPTRYLVQGRLVSQPCRGLVPKVTLSVETGTYRYTQVQSVEEMDRFASRLCLCMLGCV